MAPTPQKHDSTRVDKLVIDPAVQDLPLDGESIVISGISGLYPQSHNVKELADILYNMENPILSEGLRWNFKHPDLPQASGMAPDLDRFDAQFFSVYSQLAYAMDPMSRKLLEQAYQAIYDGGVNPIYLNGKKVAVFIGSSFSDTNNYGALDSFSRHDLLGCSKTMFANRISYWLNAKGPSMFIDESDCSSTSALEAAYSVMKHGECEAAIVGGAFLSLKPQNSLHHGRLSATVPQDGKTKSFAQDSDGYILSDTITVLLLQKAKDANRIYAELVHVKNEFNSLLTNETGAKFGYCRNPQTTAGFIKQFYKEVQVPPQEVEYVEAYGTGVPDADKSELEALEEVYCKDRQDPLLIGSVTSNVCLTEAASGMAAITKVLLGYHTGQLAANLHCSNLRQDVAALREGRMRVVTEHQPFRRSYVALNGMSVTGINSHVLLHGHYKPKDLSRFQASIPRLVTLSGRQMSGVTKIFEDLKSRPVDAEELALLLNIHENNISGHLGRGYIILEPNGTQNAVSLKENADDFDDMRRPLWFVYSGMGSQWSGMGVQLMRIPIFAAAIDRCHKVLEPEGLNIVHIITSPDKEILEDILNAFVGIAAIQIGLTDILHELGLKPDGIIGHSVGELACAYADGCLTAEEMIMCAYQRGRVSQNTPLIHGAMAAVGLGYEQVSKMCPPEIDVACHNGPDSSTISGPADVMKEFVAELTAKGVFAKEVPSSNIAYHSRYISVAGPQLLKLLKEVIKNPKPRSERWLSTSIPQKDWNEDLAKYCSAEYQTNNLLSPVLFEETSRLIPNNAVLVEVAPHGLLQAILKRSLSANCRHVSLTRRGHRDSALFLLEAVGTLYMHGFTPKVQALYPKVEFPVSTGTPMLSQLVEWMHSETWNVMRFFGGTKQTASACEFLKSVHDGEFSYLKGHVVREKRCYPFAAALVAAWDTLAMYSGVSKRQGQVQFRDVHLYSQPTLHELRPLRLIVALHRGSGKFEIMNEDYKVASGYIQSEIEKSELECNDTDMVLNLQDIYQLLQDRDYKYSGEFESIEAASASLSQAALVWRDNWATFLDGLLQLNMLRQPHVGVTLPTHIRRLDIDPSQHLQQAYSLHGKTVVNAYVSDVHDMTRCGGVILQNIKYRNLPPVGLDSRRVDLVVPPSRVTSENVLHKISGVVQQQRGIKNAVTLQCSQIGDLETLRWVEALPIQRSDLTVTVHYVGLCTPDVKRAIGVMPRDSCNAYGMDYSGITDSGERVMGLVRGGACGSVVRAHPELLWPVPAHWSLEDAATVPLAYVHALYCLIIKGGMLPGNAVLVHGGVGALGQAAIAVALAHGCTVFTTVSELQKKKFLQKLYPELKDEHIGYSRDSTFTDNVLLETNGKGCQVILSCVKGIIKTASLKCLAFSGTLVDTVQLQDADKYELGMSFMNQQGSYVASDLTCLFMEQKYIEMKYLQVMLYEGIVRGYVRPLTRVTYAPHDATRAFRLLAASRHRGKVLLRMQDCIFNADSRIICNPDKNHLLFWDDGALGVQLADKLVHRGARKLYIHCLSLNQYQHHKIGIWRKFGIEVVTTEQTADEKYSITTIINDATSYSTIEGICVAVTKVSNDKHIEELTTLINDLDAVSRSLCPDLKYFAVVSTVSSVGRDTCTARAKCGFTATSLDLSGLMKSKTNAYVLAEAAERALCSTSPILMAQPAHAIATGLLEQLIVLAGIIIPQDTDPDTTLQELGMVDAKIPIICAFLNNEYNISLEVDSIPLLSMKRIHKLVETASDVVPDNVSGLPLFFSAVAPDELLATTELVGLPTLDIDSSLSSDEFDVSKNYLCIVPGMEGHHERFRILCERLKLPALVLQPGLDHPTETVRETAQRYAQAFINKTRAQNNFYVLGYESGVLLALEIAAILEDHGLTGTVFCVGCAPDDLREILEEQLRDFKTNEQLQDSVIRHMSKLLVGEDVVELDDVLRDGGTWSQKLDSCVRVLLKRVQHSAQYTRGVIEAAMATLERTRGYVVRSGALRSQLVLLRAATAYVTSPAQALQRYSQRAVAIHQLRTPLSFVLNDMECSCIINRYLDTELLSKFEKKNQCITYMSLH